MAEHKITAGLKEAIEHTRVHLALRTIAEFPISDPLNQDAVNMQKIACDALTKKTEEVA